ncbi:MAG: sigma-70 family RNA polymerase sigma factor [Chloroflexota bacterium]
MPVERSTGTSPRGTPIDRQAPTDTFDEIAVVRLVLDGDRDAFRILVDRESASVIRACYRVLGDLSEAEDVAQEAFVTGYRALASFRSDGPFGAWLTRIAVRLAIRQASRRKSVGWLHPSDGTNEEQLTALPAHPRTQPEHVALHEERAAATRRAVAGLGEPYREVVALRFFGDRSLDEIAQLTGRPVATVKTHLRRGLIRLREQIDPGFAS